MALEQNMNRVKSIAKVAINVAVNLCVDRAVGVFVQYPSPAVEVVKYLIKKGLKKVTDWIVNKLFQAAIDRYAVRRHEPGADGQIPLEEEIV